MEFLDTLARHPALFISCCGVLGLLIGSFLNVVIHRLPIMMDNELRAECAALAGTDDFTPPTFNLVVPRSACPACKAPITALQNIPVVSWLALRGKCANCKTRISARYPLVELATGVLSAFIAWRFGFGANAVAALAFTWLLISLTMIDFDTQLLPDALTYPLLWLGLIYSLWHPAWAPGAPWSAQPTASLEPPPGIVACGASTGRSSSSPARRAWGTATSSCSPPSGPGSAGGCCCRSSFSPRASAP